jgi:fumarate reductase flavoprotein subunit
MSTATRPPAEVDVLVVGAGLAGVIAALTAAEAGASVCLLEKAAQMGGSSVRAGGGLLFAGTSLQQSIGVEDDGELLREAIVKYGRGKNHPDTVDVYIRHQLDTFDWMVGHGVEFSLFPTGTSEISRMHSTPQGYLARFLHEKLVALDNATYVADTRALHLVTEGGRVTGLVARSGDDEVTVSARRAVVLTSGGFARSEELLEKFAPGWVDAVKMSGVENTGDGLLMAWALGAGVADMGYIEASFGASINSYPDLAGEPGDEPRLLYPNSQGAIIVNLEGRRFVDENLNYKIISGVVAKEPAGIGFQVFDEKIMGRSRPSPSPADWRSGYDEGLVLSAGSVAELAEKMQVDPGALGKTVDTYNSYVDSGSDPDFGRPIYEYGGGPGHARLDTAPYYAFPCRNGLTTTYCGLSVNGRLQVLDVFGAPIEGLFAAGEVVGGFHGAAYLSGTGLGKAAVFGRAAGVEAVAP